LLLSLKYLKNCLSLKTITEYVARMSGDEEKSWLQGKTLMRKRDLRLWRMSRLYEIHYERVMSRQTWTRIKKLRLQFGENVCISHVTGEQGMCFSLVDNFGSQRREKKPLYMFPIKERKRVWVMRVITRILCDKKYSRL
jgi:hypothetical protein